MDPTRRTLIGGALAATALPAIAAPRRDWSALAHAVRDEMRWAWRQYYSLTTYKVRIITPKSHGQDLYYK